MAKRSYTSGTPEVDKYPIEFELDGISYVCNDLTPLQQSEIMRMQGLPADSPESIAFMANVFNWLLGDRYGSFRDNSAKTNTKIETYVEIIQGVFQDIAERDAPEIPTDPQSVSSDGLRRINNSLTESSSDRAMRLLSDRPDLQVAILRAKEA